jgi:hypothetical protein
MLFGRIDSLQRFIASLPVVDSSKKCLLLLGVEKGLWSLYYACKANEMHCASVEEFADAYEAATQLDLQHLSILPVIGRSALQVATILISLLPFQDNSGIQESKQLVVRRVFEQTPQNILPVLFDNPDVRIDDSLVIKIAKTQADRLYDFAQAAGSGFGGRVRTVDDPLVKWIVKLADLNSGQLFFPFLDDLVSGKVSFDEIKKSLNESDKVQYYKLLVRTAIGYSAQIQKRDTPSAASALYQMVQQRATNDFIYPVNNLHDFSDAIRLRPIRLFTPQELYYMLVMSENVIYTSSYLKIYNRLFSLMKKPDSHRLLEAVHYDHYKKFMKMAANYNTLELFLKRMNSRVADSLVKAFVSGLENTGNLEDAVDVADSYASIADRHLRRLMLAEIDKNLSTSMRQGNAKGTAVYQLLQLLFLSLDTSQHIDVSSAFGIPSVYGMQNHVFRDSTGRIIMQQFFYGDEDGITQYAKFIATYRKAGWLIKKNSEWTTVQSASGVPVVIYSNNPLDTKKELDAKAQADLGQYLSENGLRPSVVIHRGHSYHVSSTIEQLAPSAKIVILGSCGGYHNLSGVLKVCPAVHIISTKQEGSGNINEPLILTLAETLQAGNDIFWPSLWKALGAKLKNSPKFQDYIPPHRNLGAIFLVSYQKRMGRSN